MTDKHQAYSRRRFLTTSITGLASAGLVGVSPQRLFAQDADREAKKPAGDMIYRELGRTGLKVPIVSMGVMNANIPDVVSASYDLGVRHFDTAARYQYGRNEQMVGNVLDRMSVRDNVLIATKIMRPAQRDFGSAAELKQKVADLCDGSLKRLKTDYIDILYIHSVQSAEEFSNDDLMAAMEALKKAGKVRAVGVSTHRSMANVINEVTRAGFYDVVLTAVNVAMADNAELLTAIDEAAAKGVGIVAMKTQVGGQRLPHASLQDYSSSTIATASLKWVLRRESIATSIPGYDNFEHMREDVSVAFDLEYTDDEKKFLSENDIKLSMGFCEQCSQCLPTCPHGVEVPTLMRTYMYAAQYGNFSEARAALAEIPRNQGLASCALCAECRAACANAVDIPGRIRTLREIYG
jgi:predicted aldo/keto reductase-like oxidoreductase